MSKTKLGIIGLGYVGGALRKWFETQDNCELFLYDKYKNTGSVFEVNKAEIIFIVVPTPFHENGIGYDDSAVSESVANMADGKVIVIKSTILPGTTEALQKKHPEKIILFNPEFLRAKTAEEDFLRPDTQIMGYAGETGKNRAQDILNILPKAPYERIIRSTEAELVKYFKNAFFATKVVFANQMYDLCEAVGGMDYRVVKDCVGRDPRIGPSHLDIFHDGYRGYDGACLPKDTKALIQLSEKLGSPLELVKKVDELNKRLH